MNIQSKKKLNQEKEYPYDKHLLKGIQHLQAENFFLKIMKEIMIKKIKKNYRRREVRFLFSS